MTVIISGTDGVSDVDGTAGTPAIRGTDANTGIFFGADIIGFSEGGAECARFNADAQFVAAAGTALLPVITTTGDVNTGIFFPAADTIAFAEGGAEAMRIDSSGNLLVGTTGGAARLNVVDATKTTGSIARASASSGSFTGNLIEGYGARASTNGSYNLIEVLNGDASGLFKVLDSGNAQNTNNSYGATSDIKLKENVTNAAPKLDKLTQVRVVNYNLKINPDQKLLGVIAQELEQIFPGMVEETPDKDAEGNELGTVTKGVKYSVFVPMLIKGLQELKTINDAQASRIETLETKVAALEAQ